MKYNRILLFIALCMVSFNAFAQRMLQDNSVRIGKLSNGLTYYIKHNSFVKNEADFYLAQRVGSILETPNQRGLAHFLEHMAFNGTVNFPQTDNKPGVVQWCESVGIKFGANLNAYTSVDQTVYNISAAPVTREGIVDSCLLVLHDWSCGLLLTDKEIDKERGVIEEEWRTRRSAMAMQRLLEQSTPIIYKGTKYEDCLPIGSMDIVRSFPYKQLKDYYKRWYRPDLQAVIVVGDVDVDKVEAKIKACFGAIPQPKNAEKRVYYPVSDNKEMIVFCAKDAEQPVPSFSLYMKRDVTPWAERETVEAYKDNYLTNLVISMLNNRFDVLQKKHSKEILAASVQDGNFFISNTKDAFMLTATLVKERVKEGISLVVGELERARKHGFTETELLRAKDEALNDAQNSYNDRNKVRNSMYVEMCVNNFLNNSNILTPDVELQETKRLNGSVSLADVNAMLAELVHNTNEVATLFVPDSKGAEELSEQQLKQTIVLAQQKDYPKYEDMKTESSFISTLPQRGTIVKEEKTIYGYTHFTLSNGMNVYVKPTSYEDDEINLRAFSIGGKSLYSPKDTHNLTYLIAGITAGGLSKFDELTLNRMLSGKTVNVSPFIGEDIEGIKGNSVVRNAKELFELVHLYFTSPRVDSAAFKQMIDEQKSFTELQNQKPGVVYNDSLMRVVYGNNPQVLSFSAADLDKVNYKRIIEIYKERFANAADFNVIITGSVDIEKLKPFLCQYLASLPSAKGREMRGKNIPEIQEKDITRLMVHPQAIPVVRTSVLYSARIPYSVENEIKLDILASLLRSGYLQSIREDKGGAYNIKVTSTLAQYPYSQMVLKVAFSTAPEKYKELIPLVDAGLLKLANNGVDAQELGKIKTYLLKTYKSVVNTNEYWEELLFNYLYNNVDADAGYQRFVEQLTPQDMQRFAKLVVENKKRIEVTMSSEKIQ